MPLPNKYHAGDKRWWYAFPGEAEPEPVTLVEQLSDLEGKACWLASMNGEPVRVLECNLGELLPAAWDHILGGEP